MQEKHAKPYKLTKSVYHNEPATLAMTGELPDPGFEAHETDEAREIRNGLYRHALAHGEVVNG